MRAFALTMMIAAASVAPADGQGAGSSAQAAAPNAPASAPIVQVGVYGYRSDGTASSMAYDTEPSLESTVFIRTSGQNSCTMGAGGAPPGGATDVWRFAGKLLGSSPEEVVLQLEWQRTVAGGSEVSSPGTSQVLTLRGGDRVLLDSVAPPSAACWASVGFEARFMPRPFAVTGIAYSPQRGAYQLGGVGRVSGGSGSGRSGAVKVTSQGSGIITTVPQYDVNLWLVRRSPGQADASQHQVLRVDRDEVAFAFPPADAATPTGQVSVQVTGSVAVTTGSNGPQLVVTTNRRVASARANESPRDGMQGKSRTGITLPGPQEVLSFEMPPLPGTTTGSAGDQFSVRLTITPR